MADGAIGAAQAGSGLRVLPFACAALLAARIAALRERREVYSHKRFYYKYGASWQWTRASEVTETLLLDAWLLSI